MKYYRRIIKIGNSLGVTIPKKEVPLDLEHGQWVEVMIKKVR